MASQKKRNKQQTRKSDAVKNALNPSMPREHFGLDFFHFWNGDTYVGNYKATVSKELTREGKGKYFTNDGSSYCGLWMNDELLYATKIYFKDGSIYIGHLLNQQFNGQCVYSIPGIGTCSSNFVEGKPVGIVLFDDVDNNKWQGEVDSSGIIIHPKNHFFYSEQIEENIETGKQQVGIIIDDSVSTKDSPTEFTNLNNTHQLHIIENIKL